MDNFTLEQAEKIAEEYKELLEFIERNKDKIEPPTYGSGWKMNFFYLDPEYAGNVFTAYWSRYLGCSEYEDDTTSFSLKDLFKEPK